MSDSHNDSANNNNSANTPNSAHTPNSGNTPNSGEAPETGQEKLSREDRGRFGLNNPGGCGNPFGRRCASFRVAFLGALSKQTLHGVAVKLSSQALEGHVPSAKLLLSYAIGTPAKPVDPDTLDAQEFSVLKGDLVSPSELHEFSTSLPVKGAMVMAIPCLMGHEQQCKDTIKQTIQQAEDNDKRKAEERAKNEARDLARAEAQKKRKEEQKQAKLKAEQQAALSALQGQSPLQTGVDCPSKEGVSDPSSEGGFTVTPRRLTDEILDNERQSATDLPDIKEGSTLKKDKLPGESSV
jgi:hypothetical protein